MIKGRFTYGEITEKIWGQKHGDLIVGSFCSIGQNVVAYLSGEHRMDFVTTYPFSEKLETRYSLPVSNKTNGDIVIGNDVWIADNVTLMSGCKIGDGCVIGNGSVVRGIIKPYSVVCGNPTQFICYRFNEDIIKKLLEIKWWEWEDDKIKEASPVLLQTDIKKFILWSDQGKNT